MEIKNTNDYGWKVFVLLIILIFSCYWLFLSGENDLSKINTTSNKQEETNMTSSEQEKLNIGIGLSSESFQNNQFLPKQYSYKGGNINPQLSISNVPNGTKSLALIVDDPDAPGTVFAHWLVWNIPADTAKINENSVPLGSVQGLNAFGNHRYDGPYPPSGTHRYFFKIYALDTILDLDKNSKRADLENNMKGHILSEASLVGLYSK